ncbi:MAG TPA: rhomboid family intramembrane serine protease, partial [Terriglobales bacterium]|nr:rhomboid family intramembrane serine protease [Terriglobales bacterium]
PNCGLELQTSPNGEVFCPECSLVEARQPGRSPHIREYVRRFPATTILIAINTLVFVAMVLGRVSPMTPSVDQLIRWGADSGEKVILQNQWWRIVTSAFVHIGAAHLIMNMWALWVLGTLAEAVLGSYLYVGVYLVCAIAGSLTSLYWNPFAVGAGASGAIMGILGAEVSVLKFAHLPIPKEVLRSTIRSLVQGALLTLVIGLLPRIDNASHTGGLVCGLFLGLLLSLTRRAGYNVQRPLRQICLLAPLALMVPLALAVQRHGEPWVHYQRAAAAFDDSQYAEAEREARVALKHLPHAEPILTMLASCLYFQGEDAEASNYLRQILAENPRNEIALNTLAAIELKENDVTGARDLLNNSVPFQPRNAYAQVYLGRALQMLNDERAAIEHYRQALQINPNLYEAQMALGSVYENHGQPKDAILFYQKAEQIRPNEIEPLRSLARVYLLAGMKPEANRKIAEIRKRERVAGDTKNRTSQSPGAGVK